MPRPRHTARAARRAHRFRRSLTISEARLWSGISRGQTGARFRRQVPIGSWIVDFASLDPRLVVEVDDESHHWRDETARDEHLEALGFVVLRFGNGDIAQHPSEAVDTVRRWVEALRSGERPDPFPPP